MAVWSEVRFSQLESDIRIDSEYYQPEYLELDKLLANQKSLNWGDIEGEFIGGPFGSAFHVDNYVEFSPYRYVRGRDVKPFFLLDNANCFIPREHFLRLRKYALKTGDLLVSVVGTLGNVTIITDDVIQAIFSCKSTAFRSNSFDPKYLCAYLNSKIGQNYLQRMVRGHVQTGLNLGDLRAIPIFIPSEQLERTVASLVCEAYENKQISAKLYENAQSNLLEELNLNVDLSPALFYERSFSETLEVTRFDAEHFQPAYQRVVDICKSYRGGYKTLGDLLDSITNGVESRTFVDDGVPYIRVGDMGKLRIVTRSAQKIPKEDARKLISKIQLREGDVLAARSGSIGQAAVVTIDDHESILSSHLMRLRPSSNCPLQSTFLSLFLATTPGVHQILRNGNGGIVPEISQPNLKRIVVPTPSQEFQEEITSMIQKSHKAEDECYRLIEKAKRIVERAVIEGD